MSGTNDVLRKFEEAISGHVPPEAERITIEEVCLRVPVCYRIRVRGSDMNFEVVGRFTGFTVPDDGDPEVLILEFTSEHSYNNENEDDE